MSPNTRAAFKILGRWLFGLLFVLAGIMHFAKTDFYTKIMPPYLPFPRELVLLSGAFEAVLGAMLLLSRTSRLAAWVLIALLIAVFPANLYMYQHRELFPYPPAVLLLLLRLPLQAVLILWAYAYTRPRLGR